MTNTTQNKTQATGVEQVAIDDYEINLKSDFFARTSNIKMNLDSARKHFLEIETLEENCDYCKEAGEYIVERYLQ